MSLINCKECNKEISENAKTCPHCGNPITIWQANADIKQNVSNADIKRILLIVFGCIILFVGFCLMFNGTSGMLESGQSISSFEILESTSNISEDGIYTIKGKIKQNTEENFDGLFVGFILYDNNNIRVRSTSTNISCYLGDNIWEFEAYGNDADKIVTSYKLDYIQGY